jgi:hypothetical protein
MPETLNWSSRLIGPRGTGTAIIEVSPQTAHDSFWADPYGVFTVRLISDLSCSLAQWLEQKHRLTEGTDFAGDFSRELQRRCPVCISVQDRVAASEGGQDLSYGPALTKGDPLSPYVED